MKEKKNRKRVRLLLLSDSIEYAGMGFEMVRNL